MNSYATLKKLLGVALLRELENTMKNTVLAERVNSHLECAGIAMSLQVKMCLCKRIFVVIDVGNGDSHFVISPYATVTTVEYLM
jgi:hypothetical protein